MLRTLPRSLSVSIAFALVSACAPRPRPDPGTPTPPPGTAWPVVKNESGSLTTSGGVTTYEDRASRFVLTAPAGFTGAMSFTADPSGPPIRGAVKLRLTDGQKPACVIHVAVERIPSAEASTLAATIASGREVFYLSETGEPRPDEPGALEPSSVWSATLVPATAETRDLGYWLFTPEAVLSVEGRFPVSRLGACKESLDAVVRSLRSLPQPAASR